MYQTPQFPNVRNSHGRLQTDRPTEHIMIAFVFRCPVPRMLELASEIYVTH